MRQQKNVYSVGQVNNYIKNMFTQDFLLKRIYVRGEVSNCKYHPSGHIYFSLKDETGTMPCVMFLSFRKGLTFQLENGQSYLSERNGRTPRNCKMHLPPSITASSSWLISSLPQCQVMN